MPRKHDPPPLSPEDMFRLERDGLINPDGTLTGDGELKLHQLKLREWMAKNPPEVRAAKRKAAAARQKQRKEATDDAADA